MVSRVAKTIADLNRRCVGTGLIWIGVLSWVPFIILRAAGSTPSLFWFLPFHLVGVIGGSRIRSMAHPKTNLQPTTKSIFQVVGHTLIFIGILVWGPYFYLKLLAGSSVDVGQFLPYHLIFVLSGIFLLQVNFLLKWRKEKNNHDS